jgi:hypothetical protein
MTVVFSGPFDESYKGKYLYGLLNSTFPFHYPPLALTSSRNAYDNSTLLKVETYQLHQRQQSLRQTMEAYSTINEKSLYQSWPSSYQSSFSLLLGVCRIIHGLDTTAIVVSNLIQSVYGYPVLIKEVGDQKRIRDTAEKRF